MICPHCKAVLASNMDMIEYDLDEYDLMKGHIWSCKGMAAANFRKAIDKGE